MELKDQNILFFSRSTQHGGTEKVILQLCEVFKTLVNNIVVVSADGFDVGSLNKLDIKHYVIPDIEDKSLCTVLSVSRKIKKIVKDENITVIHTHHRMAAFYVRLLGLYKYCYFINTSHNTFSNKRLLTRYAYRKARLISCGDMVKRNLESVYNIRNVTVIHNAVNSFDGNIKLDVDLRKDKSEGKFLVGNIGRLSEQKGMKYFIKAIPYVLKKHSKVQFYIIGSGEEESSLKELAKNLPVKFLGYRTDIQNLMSQLDLVVLSSLWEGLPLTPIEAFSVGKTIVATAVDGTIEIVKHNKNGLVVGIRDVEGLANNINWIIEHPNERLLMEQKAQDTFDKEFSFKVFSKSYIDFYRSL